MDKSHDPHPPIPPTMPRPAIVAFFWTTIGLICWADVITGPDIGVALFYLVPVAAASWLLGARLGLPTAGLAFLAWMFADLYHHGTTPLAISAWNGATRGIIFVGAGWAVDRLRRDREALSAAYARLEVALAHEAQVARTDPVTGLANRRQFVEVLEQELVLGRRAGVRLALAFVDLDHFKLVNDRFGHAAGDEALRLVGEEITACLRAADSLARIGGDEFGVVLWALSPEDAERTARRILAGVRTIGDRYPGVDLGASIGLLEISVAPTDISALLRQADALMYRAKEAGRNCVVRDDGDSA